MKRFLLSTILVFFVAKLFAQPNIIEIDQTNSEGKRGIVTRSENFYNDGVRKGFFLSFLCRGATPSFVSHQFGLIRREITNGCGFASIN